MVWCGPNLSKLDQILKKEWIDKIEGEITLKQKLTTEKIGTFFFVQTKVSDTCF